MDLLQPTTRERTLWGASAALALIAVPACGGKTADHTGTALQAVNGPDAGLLTISGTVSDSQFTQAGVTITLNGSSQASAVTNGNGVYSFSVKPGSYSLTVSATPNFFPPPFTGCLAFEPSIVNLNNLTASTTVDFFGSGTDVVTSCAPTSHSGATSGSLTISGAVTSSGQPVPGVAVLLNGSAQGFRITDETGAFTFSVNPGSYSLKPAAACSSFSPGVVNLNNVKTSKTQNFAGTGCPPPPLTFCPAFDLLYEFEQPACATVSTDVCANERSSLWAGTVPVDFVNINAADCRFGQWALPPIANRLTSVAAIQWSTDLFLFTLQLFGCALEGNLDGPLPFALIPSALASLPFTTADLAALSQEYVASISQTLSDNGSPPLTAAQINAFNAQLASAASRVAKVTPSSKLTYSTCGADAGTQ